MRPELGEEKQLTRFAWLPTKIGVVTQRHRKWVWLCRVVHTYIFVTWPYKSWMYIGTDKLV